MNRYTVWVLIEETDEEGDVSESEPIELAAFDEEGDAEEFVEGLR